MIADGQIPIADGQNVSQPDNEAANLDDSIEFITEYIDLDGPVQPALKVKTEVVAVPKAINYKTEPEPDDVKQEVLVPVNIAMPHAIKFENQPQPRDSSIDQSKTKFIIDLYIEITNLIYSLFTGYFADTSGSSTSSFSVDETDRTEALIKLLGRK